MKRLRLNKKNKKLWTAILLLGIFIVGGLLIYVGNLTFKPIDDADAATPTYKRWDEITLNFTGSHNGLSQNSSNPNPFLDYRLTVTFVNGSKSYVVPGYFVGNGSGGSGNQWRAHFTADREGSWTYSARLTTGKDVAVNGGGTNVNISPASGSFQVSGDSTAGGFYSNCGRLNYVGKHYLECAKTKTSWIKGGSNSPENFLAGADTGQEANIKKVIDYLSSQQVNSIYFLPNNIGGDGKGDTHPYAFNYTTVGSVTYDNLTHYNVSRMNKWNEIFNYALKKDISLEFVLNETESENSGLLGRSLTTERKLYYRELVARFSHLPAVRWIIMEENTYSNDLLRSFAGYIRETDPYDHPIAVHSTVNSFDFYSGLIGNPNFESASLQFYTHSGGAENASSASQEWREKSTTAGRPWIIELDEAILSENPGYGMTKGNMDDLRRRVLYPGYFSGANISWYFGYDQDLGMSLWKFEEREPMWKWMAGARRLLSQFPGIADFRPGDHLIVSQNHGGGKTQVYYDPGKTFLVYMAKTTSGGNAKIDLSSAAGKPLTMQWFSPKTGQYEGSTQNITPSANFEIGANPKASSGDRDDWVVVFTTKESTIPTVPQAYYEKGGLLVIQPENRPVSAGWSVESTLQGYTGTGYIKWVGQDIPPPGVGQNEYKFYITNPGRYEIRIRSNKIHPEDGRENDVWLRIDNGTWYKAYNGNPKKNSWEWNTQYEIVHLVDIPPAHAQLSAGFHTLYLSGRERNFYIDRIHFYLPSVSNPTSVDHPESEFRAIPSEPLSCNSVCSTDSECMDTNDNWVCAQQYNQHLWSNSSSSYATIQYRENNQIKTETGENTGMNLFLDQDGVFKFHLVKNGKVFYKERHGTTWDAYWQNVTSNVSPIGCDQYSDCGGTIIGFNTMRKQDGTAEQHLIRRNSNSTKIFGRTNNGSWSNWQDVTSNISAIGTGPLTGFTSHVDNQGKVTQTIIRGGRLWERTNSGSWSNWTETSSTFSSCTGATQNNCGTGTILTTEKTYLADGTAYYYVLRQGNILFARTEEITDSRCRLKSNPDSLTCSVAAPVSNTPTPTMTNTPKPTTVPTATPSRTPTPTVTPSRTPSLTPTPTKIQSSPTPSTTTMPVATTKPPIEGVICGPADIDGDGMFTITDFGAYQVGFASFYRKTCIDNEEMRESYKPCGGKDIDEDGIVEINDFQSFAQRYDKTTCVPQN